MDWVWAAGVVGATGGEGEHDVTGLLLTLLVLFVAAKIGAEIFERLRQPAVVGEILAGVIVGPQVLHWVEPSEVTFALSELGVVFLLFMVGLETKPSDLLAVGRQALLVAAGGVALPMVLGYFFALHHGSTQVTALFVGAALVATSVGITARVLARLGYLHTRTARIILGAAVIDDILGLLVLAVVSGFARTGAADFRQIALTGLYAISFVLFMLFFGCRVMARALPAIDRLRIGQSVYLGAIGFCLTLSVVAGYLGVAAIVGAFLAGMALSEASEEIGLHRHFDSLSEFFIPFFLAGIGMHVKLSSLTNPSVLVMCLVLTLLAILGKVIGCSLPVLSLGGLRAMQVGVGMVPRGEVGIIVAQLGLGLGALTDDLFAVVLFVAVVTTMVAPPLLALLYKPEPRVLHVDEDATTAEVGIDIS